MLRQLQRFLEDESGTAAVEYTLLVSCIAVVIIPGVKNVGQKLVEIFTLLENAI